MESRSRHLFNGARCVRTRDENQGKVWMMVWATIHEANSNYMARKLCRYFCILWSIFV